MNRKQFIGLLFLLLVLGGAGLKFWSHNSASWSGGGAALGQKLLGEFDVNAIAQVYIKQDSNELSVQKKNDRWVVVQRGDYPANFSELSSLLLKLKDLKVVQSETVGASQRPRLELGDTGSNAATVVEFRDSSGKAIKTLRLGKKHLRKSQGSPMMGDSEDPGWPDGRYVMTGEAKDQVALISDPLSNLEPKPENWLNKDFFKVEKARSVAVTFPITTNSWKLEREKEGGEFRLVDAHEGEQLDSSKVSGMSYPFSSPSFVDVVLDGKSEATGLDQPKVISIDTFDGFNYTIKTGVKTNDNYYLNVGVTGSFAKERTAGKDEKTEDKTKLDKEFADNLKKLEEKLANEKAYEPWTYLVSGWTVDSLLKERATLMAEKKEAEKKEGAGASAPADPAPPAEAGNTP